ncbi:MAG TPA: FUSC family protein [Gemmatimonadaceae bacterium]|jgi:uncharacterized membrane protein YccC
MIRTNFARRTLHDARVASELAKARPAYAAGFRAAVATVTPLLADHWFGTGGGAWMSLAGLNGALIDRGGPYRMRAATMSMLAVASSVTVLIAAAAAGHPWAAVPVAFVVAFACGLMRAWPDVGTGFGVTILITFAIALSVPVASVSAALSRSGFVLIGGGWALLIAVVVWPLQPYRPVRLAVAACYRALADYVSDIVARTAVGRSQDSWELKQHLVTVRTALETARTALALSRRGRSAETGRGERLLILHELADQLYAHVIALSDVADSIPAGLDDTASRSALTDALRALADWARKTADGIELEGRDVALLSVNWHDNAVRNPDIPIYGTIANLIDRMADYATAASATVATLNSGSEAPEHENLIDIGEVGMPRSTLFSLSAVMHPDSVVLHHALRLAIVTSAAVLVAKLFHLNHDYWVTLTAIVILQPFGGATRQKALQRVVGTILGGAVAAALSVLFQDFAAVTALIAIFTALCVALLPVNYGAYAVFGTPAFVLLAESSVGDWHLAGIRIANTLIGGTLALFGARVLWPSPERNRTPEFAADALRANKEFLAVALALATGSDGATPASLRDARRRVALAASNAEESFQRLVGEHTGAAESLEPMMAFLVYTRRFASSTAALALASGGGSQVSPSAVRDFSDAATYVFDDLADSVTAGRMPAPFPAPGAVTLPDERVSGAMRARVNRLARQLRMLHDAVERWMAAAA